MSPCKSELLCISEYYSCKAGDKKADFIDFVHHYYTAFILKDFIFIAINKKSLTPLERASNFYNLFKGRR